MNKFKTSKHHFLTKLLIVASCIALLITTTPLVFAETNAENPDEMVLPLTFVGNSVSEDVSGLAFLFKIEIEGMAIKPNTGSSADFTNATLNGHKLLNAGVTATNGKSTTTIEAKNIYDQDGNDVYLAYRIINIPEEGYKTNVTVVPYFEIEVDDAPITIYGKEQVSSYNKVVHPEEYENIIPEGASYYDVSEDITLQGGDCFPEKSETGDMFIYDDYEYKYNYSHNSYEPWILTKEVSSYTKNTELTEGWGIYYTGNEAAPHSPLSSVNNCPVTSAAYAFFLNLTLEEAPVLPDTIEVMCYAFSRCENLKYVPSVPSSTKFMIYTFFECFDLQTSPEIAHLEDVTVIISTYMSSGLTTLPALPDHEFTQISSVFYDCLNLVDASDFVIPKSVTDTYAMFYYCENLKYAPRIPEHVTSISRMFRNCYSLEGTVIIDGEITEYSEAFKSVDMSKITLAGECPDSIKESIAKTGKNYANVTIE